MRNLFLTAAVAALVIPMSAHAGDKMKAETKDETSVETKMHADHDMEMVKFDAAMISARELLGEGISGADGERIARIDDVVIGADGHAQKVVFLSGGIFGLGGKRGAIDFDTVGLTMDSEYEPIVRVSLTEDAIQNVAEFETEEINDYSLASEIIGARVALNDEGDDDDHAVINDIIMSKDGMAKYLIVQESVIGSIGAGQKYAVDFNLLKVEQGDGGLLLNITEDQLEASPRYASWASAAANSWDKPERAIEKASDKTKAGMKKSVDKMEHAADKADHKMDHAADKAADKIEDAADDAGDEIEDAADDVEDEMDQ